MFTTYVALPLGCVAALVITIVLYINVMPRKKDGHFSSPLWQKLHDFFHFKKLYLEEVLKFFYVLATTAVVCIGFFIMFAYEEYYHWGYYDYYTTQESTFLYGLLVIVVGVPVVRLVYESAMMFILLVKNTIDINNKLSTKKEEASAPVVPAAPLVYAEPAAPVMEPEEFELANPVEQSQLSAGAKKFCGYCGIQLDADAVFCHNCGAKLQ